jgi:hypothetical protein
VLSMSLKVSERFVSVYMTYSNFAKFTSLKHGYKHPITIVSMETYPPIDRSVAVIALHLHT